MGGVRDDVTVIRTRGQRRHGKAGGMRQDNLDGGDLHLAPTVRISFLRAY